VLEFHRWQDTVKTAIRAHTLFDPAHARLRSRLVSLDATEFERGVVELLNVLGLPTVWHGKGPDGKSDGVTVFQEWDGKVTI
jgi:hypothetical protein